MVTDIDFAGLRGPGLGHELFGTIQWPSVHDHQPYIGFGSVKNSFEGIGSGAGICAGCNHRHIAQCTGLQAASLALPFFWVTLASPDLWMLLLLLGILGTVGHFVLILAYKRAQPSVLTPYLYGQIVFAMLGGWLVFSQVPDAWSLVGIALITGCGALGTWLTVRESQISRTAESARVAPEPVES